MRFTVILFFLFVAAFYATSTTGCANIVPPQGGPRDSLPPRLLRVSPADSSVNFSAKRIEFEFDEFIDLKELTKNTLFTPTFERNPDIRVRLRTMTMLLEEPLEPNTTYTFNFGNAVTDINENNPLRNFTYTFSTGPVLDSLTLTGNVLMAESGTTDSTLIVLLYKNLADSAVKTARAPYLARVDSAGNFNFKNLPPGRYAVYVLDGAGSRNYFGGAQTFAFADTPVVVAAGTSPSIQLFAYKEQTTTGTTNNTTAINLFGPRTKGENRLRLISNAAGTPLDLGKNFLLTADAPLRRVDSTGIQLTDTSFNPVPYFFGIDSARRNITLTTTLAAGTKYNVLLAKDFATDSAGRQLLKSDTLSFTTKRESDYGAVRILMKGIDTTTSLVLQLLQNNSVVAGLPVVGGVASMNRLPPGEYSLRLLYDRNRNGVWDAGRFFSNKRQPERVQPLARKITLKPAFTNELEIAVPPLQ